MDRVLSWLLPMLTGLVFLPALAAGFVWDDNVLIVENLLTDSWANLPAMLRGSLWDSTPVGDGGAAYYRPLMLVSLLVDRTLFGLSPLAHHAHSLLWHLLAVALGWRLLRRWLPPLSAAAGLALFAVHPLQVEPVTFIAARNDLMAAALLLAGLLALCRSQPRLVAGGLAICAAALCKESVVLAPGLYAAVELARTGRPGTRHGHVAILAAIGGVFCLRAALQLSLPAGASAGSMLAALGPMLASYSARGLVPVELLPGLNLGWPPPIPWWALGAVVLLSAGLVWAGRRAAAGGLVFAGLSLAPAVAAVAHVGAVPDRYAYLPLLGIGMAVGAAAGGRRWLAVVLWAGLGLLSGLTVPHWKDDLTLWRAAHGQHQTPYTAGILAKVVDDMGGLDLAAQLYAQATQAPRPFHESCYNVTRIHLKRGDMAAAVSEGQRALAAGCERSPELLSPMAWALAQTGQWDEAEVVAAEVVQDPTGLAVVVRAAAGVRRGDRGPMEAAIRDNPDADPRALERAVQNLLDAAPP